MAEFGRLLTAMITPMHADGEINYAQARTLAKALVASGNDGLVIGGTTGEAPAMSNDEKLRLFGEIKEAVGSGVAVVAGTTDNNHRNSVELTKEAERLGVDGILCTVPAYNKPQQEGLIQHFKVLAGSTSLPCMLYNVPSRAALNMEVETTLQLAEIDNIVGVKEASSDAVQITKIIDKAPDGFRVWSGNDDETFPVMCMGGYGVVSVAGHLVAGQIKTMMHLILDSEIERAAKEHRRLLPLFKALFWVTSPVPVKFAINRIGLDVGPTRLPLVPAEEAFIAKFNEILDHYQLDLASEI
ncbi:MAG: 4-hydroxy-tetrahydrodipicolinate synthase [Candidatus Latescibacteria bacterium]|nr:4-hydroxy-tetrahydrodipicolinate synthase [Candidatus Latescibacterota bacterium]